MNVINSDFTERSSSHALDIAEAHFMRCLEAVNQTIFAADDGDPTAAKKAAEAARDLKRATQTIFDERQKVEAIRKKEAGIANGYAIDFDAARSEIGRRLACLTADRTAREIPK
ncbi:MAG: hypothetical protein ACPGVK_09585 [Halocynthiibacter sp.]